MVKKIAILVFSLILILPVNVFSNSDYPVVEDNAKLFSNDAIQNNLPKLESFKKKYDIPVYIHTSTENLGSNTRTNADHLLMDRVGKDNNGILLLVDYYNTEIYISTSGYAIDVLDDDRIDNLLDLIYKNVRNDPDRVLNDFVNKTGEYLDLGPQAGQHRVKEKSLTIIDIAIAVVAGFVVYLLTLSSIKYGFKPKYKRYVFPLMSMMAASFIINKENLVDTRRSVTRIQRNNSSNSSGSGPRSTTHKTGGGTFGGGGRKF